MRQKRIEALRRELAAQELDAFFSVYPSDNQYLSGFTGSTSGIILTRDKALFLCDSRYTEQAAEQVQGFEQIKLTGGLIEQSAELLKSLGVHNTAFNPNSITFRQYTDVIKTYTGEFSPMPDLMTHLRRIKSPEEIDAIRAAQTLTEEVLAEIRKGLVWGVTEQEIAARMEYEFKVRGADGAAFDSIVLFGARSSLPHGKPSDALLQAGDFILLDFGCRLNGYCSDLTRTFIFGTICDPWMEEIYSVVLTAQCLALEAARPGMTCKELDAVARDFIQEAGYGEQFGHGLGHGVGIEVHEDPRVSYLSTSTLEEGMVITVEPGVYFPGRGGVRIEDMAVITKQGCDILTKAPKELEVL